MKLYPKWFRNMCDDIFQTYLEYYVDDIVWVLWIMYEPLAYIIIYSLYIAYDLCGLSKDELLIWYCGCAGLTGTFVCFIYYMYVVWRMYYPIYAYILYCFDLYKIRVYKADKITMEQVETLCTLSYIYKKQNIYIINNDDFYLYIEDPLWMLYPLRGIPKRWRFPRIVMNFRTLYYNIEYKAKIKNYTPAYFDPKYL